LFVLFCFVLFFHPNLLELSSSQEWSLTL